MVQNKLQVNLKGSWRDVLSFDNRDANRVKSAAAELAQVTGKWRFVSEYGDAYYLDANKRTWETLDQRRKA